MTSKIENYDIVEVYPRISLPFLIELFIVYDTKHVKYFFIHSNI